MAVSINQISLPPSPDVKIRSQGAWATFRHTIWALFLRETKTRFGKYQLGLAWAVIDYVGQVVMYSFIFGYFLQSTTPDLPYPLFLAAGYMPYHFFSSIMSSSATALRANEGLLVYQQVKPVDPFIARVFMETIIMLVSLALFAIVAAWIGMPVRLNDPIQLVSCLVSIVLIGFGLGLMIGILSYKQPELERIVPIATRNLYFVSCILHPLSASPPNIQTIFLINPLVPIIEGCRLNLLPNYPAENLPVWYSAVFGVACVFFALSYYLRVRDTLYLE